MTTRDERLAKEPGYVKHRGHPFVRSSMVVIYDPHKVGASEHMLAWGLFNVYCKAHEKWTGARGIRRAEEMMNRPDIFCDTCHREVTGKVRVR